MKTQLVGSINEYRLGKMPSPSSNNRRIMIKDYKYLELYPESTMRLIANRINKSSTNIFDDFIKQTGTRTSTVTLNRMLADVKAHKSLYNRQVKSLIHFTRALIHAQKYCGLKVVQDWEYVLDVRALVDELKVRGIERQDFEEEYPELMNGSVQQIFKGVSKPNIHQLRALTRMVEASDELSLDIPPAVGKRWDLDEWRKTANIKKKESWEQEYD